MNKILFGVAAISLLTACPGKNNCDSSDSVCESTADDSAGTDCFDDTSVEIQSATYNCDDAGYWYDVYNVGLTGSAELYIFQTGSGEPWYEYGHEFPATQPFSTAPDTDTRGFWDDAGGCWDNNYMELDHVESYTDVVLSSSTLFDCTSEREATLTWSVVVYDTAGAAADCGSWGDDPAGTYEDYNFGACDML